MLPTMLGRAARTARRAVTPAGGRPLARQSSRRGLVGLAMLPPRPSPQWGLLARSAEDAAASHLWQPRRGLAKKAKKGKKAAKAAATQADEDEGDDDAGSAADEEELVEFDIDEAELKLDAALEFLEGRYASLQTGRAAPALIEGVSVNAYEGAPAMPLPQLGSITVRDPQTLAVQLYDPSIGNAVVKAIQSAGLDLNPSLENKSVLVPVPKMTSEGRASVIKTAGSLGEQTKQSIRGTRQEAMKQLKAYATAVTLSKDENKKMEDALQDLVNNATKKVGDILAVKTAELSGGK